MLQRSASHAADEGIDDIEGVKVLKVQPLSSFGTPVEIVNLFGSKQDYLRALEDLQSVLYTNTG